MPPYPTRPRRRLLLSLALLLLGLSLVVAVHAAILVSTDPSPLQIGRSSAITYTADDGLLNWEYPCVPNEEAGYRERLYFPAAGLTALDNSPNLQCDTDTGEIRCSAYRNQPIPSGEWYTVTLHLAPLDPAACIANENGARFMAWPVRYEQCQHACGAGWQCASQTTPYALACTPPTLSVSLTAAHAHPFPNRPLAGWGISLLCLLSVTWVIRRRRRAN